MSAGHLPPVPAQLGARRLITDQLLQAAPPVALPLAQSIGITNTACCQNLWESVPGYIVGDRREADVDEHTDKDRSLDRIIQPFRGF